MRIKTDRDTAIRERVKIWLEALRNEDRLTDSAIAIAMLSEDEKTKLQGKRTKRDGRTCTGNRRLQQDAPHPNRAWRKGIRTPNADNAFKLGEAVRSLDPSFFGGLYVAYTLGYAVEVAQALVALSKNGESLKALAFYVALPLLTDIELDDENENSKCLLYLASTSAYENAWKQRELPKKTDNLFFQYLALRQRENMDLDESRRATWLSLIDHALAWMFFENKNEILFGLVSLSLNKTWGPGYSEAQKALVKTLIPLLELENITPNSTSITKTLKSITNPSPKGETL